MLRHTTLNFPLITIIVIMLTSCMATLTHKGSLVKIATEDQRESVCEYITPITASESMGNNTAGDLQSAMNKARNKVAEAGGNAMRILSTSSNNFASTVLVEALKCDFEKEIKGDTADVIEVIDILIEGVDNGIKTTKQQDRDEAMMDAKLQAIERAGVSIRSITYVEDSVLVKDWINLKAEAILLPNYQIIDKGYQVDGTYLIILSGKVKLINSNK
jgi:hypothetical protein